MGSTFRCAKHRKEAFTSKQRALDRLTKVLAEERIGTKKTPHRVHYDDGCGFWHLTSKHRAHSKAAAEENLAKQKGRL